MNCVSGGKGHFLCINRNCQVKNSFVCADPEDQCKESHESCSLISLSYLLKKSKLDPNPRNKQNRYDKLLPIYQKSKTIATSINNALASFNIIKQINNMLEEGTPLTPDDKDKIAKFMSDRKIEQAQDNIYLKIQKQLEQFQVVINEFQLNMKEVRNKQIQQLRKKLDGKEDRLKTSQAPFGSRVDQFDGVKSTKKISKIQSNNQDFSPIRTFKNNQEQNVILPVKSKITQKQSPIKLKNVQKQSSPLKSKVTQKQPLQSKQGSAKKKQKQDFNEKGKNSSIRPRPNDFEDKISSTLKNHVPKPPLFSKITNDIQTLNSFFEEKFTDAKLIYRASENQYLVSKFHDKCDGRRNTLTLVLNQFDRIIGGYTPLPWRSGGGQWYQDPSKESFIFNLTSGQRYPLISSEKAIWCSRTYGPSFGHPDLQIADKAFHNANSCANFPNCYNNGNYKNSVNSAQLFCGTKNGHFRIKQWEVYQLSFV